MTNKKRLPRVRTNKNARPLSKSPLKQQAEKVEYDVILSTGISNNLPKSITVIQRNGTRYRISGKRSVTQFHGSIVIDVINDCDKNVNINTADLLDEALTETEKEYAKALTESLKEPSASPYNLRNSHTIRTIISTNEMNEAALYGIYIPALDVVICYSEYEDRIVHPYSGYGQAEIASKTSNEDGVNYNVTIVDNDGVYGDRFINVNGEIFKIERTVDPCRENGVYVTKENLFTVSDGACKPKDYHYYRFDEADAAVPLWRDAISAQTLGDYQQSRNAEFKEREHQLKLREHEMRLAEQAAKERANKFEQDLEAVKRENTFLKQSIDKDKMLRDNDFAREKMNYEFRTMERKDKSEIAKWIPGLITSILSILGTGLLLWSKFKSA